MFENSTYSAVWPTLKGKNTSNVLYRASFGTRSYKEGDHVIVFKGKTFSYKDYIPKTIVLKCMRYYHGEKEDFESYKFCTQQSQNIAVQFNKLSTTSLTKVRFVVPAITQMDTRSGVTVGKKFKKDEYVAFEEKLEGNFITFIDKRGDTLERNKICMILEAFIHFSFVVSEEKFVICGLKGVYRKDKSEFILANPTIHSREGKFGPKDKRDSGIQDVKENHTCNKFCHLFLNILSKTENGSDEY